MRLAAGSIGIAPAVAKRRLLVITAVTMGAVGVAATALILRLRAVVIAATAPTVAVWRLLGTVVTNVAIMAALAASTSTPTALLVLVRLQVWLQVWAAAVIHRRCGILLLFYLLLLRPLLLLLLLLLLQLPLLWHHALLLLRHSFN